MHTHSREQMRKALEEWGRDIKKMGIKILMTINF